MDSTPGSLTAATISGISNKDYTGNALTQEKLVVKYGETTLKAGTDYTVSYDNNVNVGTATITIKGAGTYTGTVKKTFQITISKGKTYTISTMKYKVTAESKDGKGTVTLTGTTKKKTDNKFTKLSVAKTVNIGGVSYKVTAIGDNAFKGCTKLKQVVLDNNIVTVGKAAFSGCSKLTKVTIGTGLKKINTNAFYNCKKLSRMNIKSVKLNSVGKKAIKNIKKKAIIDVPSKKVKAYKKLFKSNTGYAKTMKLK